VPTVASLRNRGFSVNLMFWEDASRELREVVSRFISLDPYLGHLCLLS
jgi:hypothetical protein